MMEEALRSLLMSSGPVSAAVAGVAWGGRPQSSELPFVVLNRAGGAPTYTMDGPTGHAEARVQVDCWALSYLAARDVALAVDAVLSGYSGTVEGHRIMGVFSVGANDVREADTDAGERFFRVSIDYIVHHYSEI